MTEHYAATIEFIIEFIKIVILPIVVLVLGFILFCYVCVLVVSPSKEQQMYQHCIDDGIKDYVCYQMTYVSAKYIPIPIPMRAK